MINFFITAFKIVFLLGFLVFIHEGGHFLVAKLCKVKVLEFAIGFGPTIWKKQGEETKYAIRLIPLGGFVRLEGEDEHVDSKRSFSNASIPKRIAIVVAGATVNIIFGLLLYFTLISIVGNNTSLVIDEIIPGYAAEQSQIRVDDEIVRVNNKNVYVKSDFDKIVSESGGEEITITVKRDSKYQDIKLVPSKQEYKSTGIHLRAENGKVSNKVFTITKDSSAEKSGIKANDRIIRINNKSIDESNDISTVLVEEKENNSIIFTVQRGNEEIDIEVIPDVIEKYFVGVQFKIAENNFTNNIYYATFKTRDFLFSLFDNVKQLFTGNISVDQMMGPVGISEIVAKTSEAYDFFYLMALISLSLGITNLLPIPALDGGKLVFLLIEAIRRKKLNEKIEINIQLIGFTILIILTIYITYNDILRII